MLLAWQKASLIWMTWLPVSNKAVTGCPLITICSSLAHPVSLDQGLLDTFLLCANPFAPFSVKVSMMG